MVKIVFKFHSPRRKLALCPVPYLKITGTSKINKEEGT